MFMRSRERSLYFLIHSGEIATKKKVVCVKMLPRNSTTDAITDIVILSKSKRAPAGYTLVGWEQARFVLWYSILVRLSSDGSLTFIGIEYV